MSRRYFAVSWPAILRGVLGSILALALVAGILPAWSSLPQASAETTSAAPDVAPVLAPASDKQGVLTLWQKGGAVTKAAAREALLGDDAQLQEFINSGQYESLKQDFRTTVIQISLVARSATRAAAEDVLADGSWQALQTFVSEGWKASWLVDDRKEAFQAIDNGTPGVKTAARNAVSAGDSAIQNFLISGKTVAENVDKRKEVFKLTASSPSVKLAANEVLRVNTPEAIDDFLRYGQFVAAARDAETATVTQLANQAKSASDQAVEFNTKAITATEQAVSASRLAKEAAQRAASEAAAAKDSALKAGAAASRAASLADQAARAAQVAVSAAQEARSALSQAIRAATNAAAAAARAEQAAANAQGAAAAAANDGSQANAAKVAAQNARDAAAGAGKAAEAAKFAADSTKSSIDASNAALSAGRNAAAAAASASYAADQSGVSSYEAGLARAASVRAKAAADRAEQASAQVNSLASQAFDTAEIARTAALDSATHANNAANNADEAARQAGNSANAAKRAEDYANASRLAAEASAAAVEKAKKVQELARKADADRLAAESAFNIAQAREDKQVADAKQKQREDSAASAQAAAATTSSLLTKLTAPGADLNAQLPEVKAAVIGVAETGGPWQKAAASLAVVSGPESMKEFIVKGLNTAREQDDWYETKSLAESGPFLLRQAASEELTSSVDSRLNFLTTSRWQITESSDRKEVYASLNSGGPEVKKAAQDALNAGTVQALREFLDKGLTAAKRTDDRKAVLALSSQASKAGPETKAAARVAFEGPDSAVAMFLATGQAEATKRDLEAAAHDAMINSLIKKAESDAGIAKANAASAQQSAALARQVADEAQRWADEAKRSAAAARVSADQAADFALQAKQSADQAAASAIEARDAATRSRTDAQAASLQASFAATSAARATNAAISAADAASRARDSSIQAGKDSEAAAAASEDAWRIEGEKRRAESLNSLEAYNAGGNLLGLTSEEEEAALAEGGPDELQRLKVAKESVAQGSIAQIVLNEVGTTLLEFIGIQDIIECFRGEPGSCIWAAAGFIPVGKVGKAFGVIADVVKRLPQIMRKVGDFISGQRLIDKYSGIVKNAAKNQNSVLIESVLSSGLKISPENVVRISKDSNGKIFWLERGNADAGLEHILRPDRVKNFADKGIPEKDIPDLLMKAVLKNDVTMSGKTPVFKVDYNGVVKEITVIVGDNGFIVTAYPR